MALIPRAPEVRALVELLEDEWDSADDLAKALLKRAFELIQDRALFGLKTVHAGRLLAVGPFAAQGDAERFYKTLGGESAAVCRLDGPGLFKEVERADIVNKTNCNKCGHPQGAHLHPKQAGKCQAEFVPHTPKKLPNEGQHCACKGFEVGA